MKRGKSITKASTLRNNRSAGDLFSDLLSVMDRLLEKDGCSWDRKQTHGSIRLYLLKEAHEALEAIQKKNWSALKEELGDLLFQIVFHAKMAKKKKTFRIEDVLAAIQKKLVSRHPNVFGNGKPHSAATQMKTWNQSKAMESNVSILDRVPKSMSALLQASELQERAHSLGFKWRRIEGVWKKLDEELRELQQAAAAKKKRNMLEELGDVLFMITNMARWHGLSAEEALLQANGKFRQRFGRLQKFLAAKKVKLEEMTDKELDLFWRKTKRGPLGEKRGS